LLGGISEKEILKKNNRGIFTINQLSYTYRPKKKPKISNKASRFEYALKSLALREQQTYLIELPNLPLSNTAIYFDFEGLPDENFNYLIGLLIVKKGIVDQKISLWADSKKDEEHLFMSITTDSATSFRLIPPPYSDPKRHPIPKHSATLDRGNLSDAG